MRQAKKRPLPQRGVASAGAIPPTERSSSRPAVILSQAGHGECSMDAAMFSGNIDHQVIIADDPVLVVDGEHVVSSFTMLHQARAFLDQKPSDTAVIFRHNGLGWDKVYGANELSTETA